MQHWLDTFVPIELPVLARTVAEIALLRSSEDTVPPQKLTDIVMRDPMMAVKVLRYVQEHRSRIRNADLTTVSHALMMLGLHTFFTQFGEQQTLEAKLANDPAALRGALMSITRARHTALYAQDWAAIRHDVDPDEIMVGALLRDCAAILLWGAAPGLMTEIAHRMEARPTVRVENIELAVLGFRILDLNLGLLRSWGFPDALITLLDDRQTNNPRVLSIVYAGELVRHSARSWKHLALLHDYFVVGKLLGIQLHAIERRVMEVGQRAAKESAYYGVKSQPPQPLLPREAL